MDLKCFGTLEIGLFRASLHAISQNNHVYREVTGQLSEKSDINFCPTCHSMEQLVLLSPQSTMPVLPSTSKQQ